jgi:hypothetical protein
MQRLFSVAGEKRPNLLSTALTRLISRFVEHTKGPGFMLVVGRRDRLVLNACPLWTSSAAVRRS